LNSISKFNFGQGPLVSSSPSSVVGSHVTLRALLSAGLHLPFGPTCQLYTWHSATCQLLCSLSRATQLCSERLLSHRRWPPTAGLESLPMPHHPRTPPAGETHFFTIAGAVQSSCCPPSLQQLCPDRLPKCVCTVLVKCPGNTSPSGTCCAPHISTFPHFFCSPPRTRVVVHSAVTGEHLVILSHLVVLQV
jgi:hypothetical protein